MIKTQDYIRESITIFFIQKNLILGVTAIIAIAAILISFFWPPTYSATGSILLKSTRALKSPESLEKVRLDVPPIRENDLFSEMEIIRSINVIEKTIQYLQKKDLVFPEKEYTPERIKTMITKIRNNLTTELIPRSNIFKVVLKWGDPQEAEILLETLMNQYLDYRASLYNPREAQKFFERQLKKFDHDLKELENNLIRLAKDSDSPNPKQEIEKNLLIEKNLEITLNSIRNKWVEQKTYVKYLEKALSSPGINFFSYIDNLEIGDFGKKLQDLIIEKESLLRVYQPDTKKVRMMEEQIKNTYQALKAEVKRYVDDQKARLRAMEKKIHSLEEELKKISSKNIALYTSLIKSKRINREISLLEESYNTFAKRWEESRIESTRDPNRLFAVSILSKACASKRPVFPNKRVVIPVGILVGFITGLTLGFLREFFDHTFKRPEDVENYANLPHICSIPLWE